ncbi:MAG: kynureninase [Phycisphaerales bacterium]
MAHLETTESFARSLDAADELAGFRERFCFPHGPKGHGEGLYFVGNSLGLMPRATRAALMQELDDWAKFAVEGHFHAKHPWLPYHEEVRGGLARLVGASEREVVAMNSLTTNLHLLMVSFYRPTRERFKIIIEDAAFPSDSYAVQSQASFHANAAGFEASQAIVRLSPREGEHTLRTADVLERIDREAASTALLLLGGVNYLSGQCMDMATITAFAKQRGVVVGWDLAHAAGNVVLKLHDWGADFAAWCSYKYLNSGPGAVAGAFVHERHLGDQSLPRFAGWWGNDPATRFKMGPDFVPVASADAWQLSNPPVLALAPLRESLAIFDEATLPRLRHKSEQLTAYLAWMLEKLAPRIKVLTPPTAADRGCQLSLVLPGDARATHAALSAQGVMTDFREPNVVRVAPVPLYNRFHDAWRLAAVLGELAK